LPFSFFKKSLKGHASHHNNEQERGKKMSVTLVRRAFFLGGCSLWSCLTNDNLKYVFFSYIFTMQSIQQKQPTQACPVCSGHFPQVGVYKMYKNLPYHTDCLRCAACNCTVGGKTTPLVEWEGRVRTINPSPPPFYLHSLTPLLLVCAAGAV
jgi:hypothetical protein